MICEECLLIGFRARREMIQPEIVGEAVISLGLVDQIPIVENKPLPVMAGPSAKLEAPMSMVDVLIEAMKNKRASSRGVSQNEQVL